MQTKIEKLKLYVHIKWVILSFLSFYVFLGIVWDPVPLGFLLNTYYLLALLLAALNNLILTFAIKRQKIAFFHPSLLFDLFLIIFISYVGGGIENTWLFLPAVIIICVGYIFGPGAAFIYAIISFLSILGMYLLEFFKLIPHFSVYGMAEDWWRNIPYGIDYLVGMFFLYFFAAAASGFFKKNMEQTTIHLEKSLIETKVAQKDAETSRKAIQNIIEDLARAKDKLEIRVKERTAELEEARATLEKKVEERTTDLEKARKAVTHMLKDLKTDMVKLQAIDRMKTEFLSMVSHELRSPLTPIKGYLSLLLDGKLGNFTAESEKALKILAKQSDHLHTLIDSLLDLSRLELGKPIPTVKEPINLQMIIQEIADAMKIQAEGKDQKLETSISKNLPTIIGDPTKLKRILINLIGNAIKFTPKDGEIKVQASVKDTNIQVEVIDSGIGISAENKEKVFERFFQVDSSVTRSATGMGMGLSLAQELVELHGGRLWVESEGPGKGCKFIFTLPIERK